MPRPRDDALDAVIEEIRTEARARAEGALWLAFFDRKGARAWLSEVDEGTWHVDELFLRHVADSVLRMGLPMLVLAVARADGRPRRIDRRLRAELTARLVGSVTELVDLVAVGSARLSWCGRRTPPAGQPAGLADVPVGAALIEG